jgi:hypothetical protein
VIANGGEIGGAFADRNSGNCMAAMQHRCGRPVLSVPEKKKRRRGGGDGAFESGDLGGGSVTGRV